MDAVPNQILSGQVSEHGIMLENAVRREVGLDADWELKDMEELFGVLHDDGFFTTLSGGSRGWTCTVSLKDPAQGVVQEGGLWPPTALARGALAAYRTWPRT